VRRREFIGLLGGVGAAWPGKVRAQQPAMPVIGFLSSRSPDEAGHLVAAFRQGLHESGYSVGQNVEIEYRWAENQIDVCRVWRPILFVVQWLWSPRSAVL